MLPGIISDLLYHGNNDFRTIYFYPAIMPNKTMTVAIHTGSTPVEIMA